MVGKEGWVNNDSMVEAGLFLKEATYRKL